MCDVNDGSVKVQLSNDSVFKKTGLFTNIL